jgi:small-conductance mechanosensitive channel
MQQSEPTSLLRGSLADVGQWFVAHRSSILAALALLVVGWLLALLLRALAVRIIRAVERIVPGHAVRGGLPRLTPERHVADIVGFMVFWAVLLFFIAAAADALGLRLLGTSISGLGLFVPRLLVAVLVLVVGLVLGNLARDALRATAAAAGTPLAPALGAFARAAILVAAALIAIAELGVDITLATAILSVTLAAVLGGFALAFGVGARTAVSNIIGSHYARQTYEVGERVRFGEVEGIIAQITATSVILTVRDGRVVVPAKQFTESISMLMLEGQVR